MIGSLPSTQEGMLEYLGYSQTPTQITIYPTNVENRNNVINVLNSWNEVKKIEDESLVVDYIDMSSVMTTLLSSLVEVVTAVLMAFSITSLVISSIMIAIIIYASVIERTKEIGVLRSLGARKKDVGRIFQAEAILIGVISGVIAIVAATLINLIINAILVSVLGVDNIAVLDPATAIFLVLLSAGLLLIASLIPASLASKKEPAVALRTE
jgi:putative ABC transport system permease protein